jgi:simple sugar transport system substrate-binding protein
MTSHLFTRRQIVGYGAASVLLASDMRAQAADTVVGFIYVGPRDDFGWNQSHAVAASTLKKIPGIKVIEEENVPETDAVAKTMESMITFDNASLIFATSFGYFDPFMIDMARKFPKVQFRHPTSLWSEDKHPGNLGGYFCYIEQAHYISGIAAGLSTTSNRIGYVAAKPIALVLRTINAFAVGAKKVNPKAEIRLIFTGEWSLPVREAEAANSLIDAGCGVVACHVDSPKVVIETAERRGAKSCGHNADQASLAPKGFITGAELKYITIYKSYTDMIVKGERLPNLTEGGFDRNMVQNTSFGAGASEAARKAAAEATAAVRGGAPIFIGPIKDNTGKLVSEKTLGLYDPNLWTTNYLVEGVIGSIT